MTENAQLNGRQRLPVLVVGAGPVGLCAALLLGRAGTPALVIDSGYGASTHPKAMGLNIRTMELFRGWGIAEEVRSIGTPYPQAGTTLIVESLAGREIKRSAPYSEDAQQDPLAGLTPETWWRAPQSELEPILLTIARRTCVVEYGRELVALAQDDDEVTAEIRNRETGEVSVVRASYVIAADGATSTARNALGVSMLGQQELSRFVNVYFRANLDSLLQGRSFVKCVIKNDKVTGVLLPVDDVDRWLLHPAVDPATPEDQLDDDWAAGMIRAAVGNDEIEVEVLGAQLYWTAASYAERYQEGRVFLVGDAAHTMPPSGAFGMNTGIQDVHNLVWKIVGVLNGWAGPSVLDTYEAERLPVGEATVAEASGQHSGRSKAPTAGQKPAEARREKRENDLPAMLGYSYASTALSGVDSVLDGPIPEDMPTSAQVGTRAPHMWVELNGERHSTLDLFEGHYTLIAGSAAEAWLEAAREIAVKDQIPLQAEAFAPAGSLVDVDNMWDATYGLGSKGAVLVRPDGFVAWMTTGTSELTALGSLLATTLGLASAR